MSELTDILTRFRALVAARPKAPIYVWLDKEGRDKLHMNATEVDQASDALAARIVHTGRLKPGDRALLVFFPSLDFAITVLACIKAGVVGVSVAPPDPFAPSSARHHFDRIADDCGARVAITHRRYRNARRLGRGTQLLRGQRAPWPELEWRAIDERSLRQPPPAPLRTPSLDELAFLQYTSGSTSAPRGVRLLHRNLAHNLDVALRGFEMDMSSRGVVWVPHFHDLGLLAGVLSPLSDQGVRYLMSPLTFLAKPALWFEVMSRVRATHTVAPHFAYDLAVRKTNAAQRGQWDLSRMVSAMSAAEPIRWSSTERFLEAFAVSGFPRRAFVGAYGLAESTVGVTIGGRGAIWLDPGALERGQAELLPPGEGTPLHSSGPPDREINLRIVDPETCVEAPERQIGEIWTASESVADGYWGRPELSEEVFGGRLADDPRRYLRTGDLGFLHQGQLYVSGRRKDLIIVRGRNLYPQDIELLAEEATPAVKPGRVVAFGVTRDEVEIITLVAELRDLEGETDAFAAAQAVADAVAKLGAAVEVRAVRSGGVPKTTSGKVRRHAARAAHLGGSLDDVTLAEISRAYTPEASAPSTPASSPLPASSPAGQARALPHQLATALALVLGPTDKPLDPSLRLTELGLDSLRAMELETQLNEACETELSLLALAASGATLADLAALLEDRARPEAELPKLDLAARLREKNARVDAIRERGDYLLEQVSEEVESTHAVVHGRRLLMVASYSYLGLIGHPRLAAAAEQAARRYGTGNHGVRLLAGTLSLHRELEHALARFAGTEAALVLSSGYAANTSAIAALVGPGDWVIGDSLNHASIVDGAQLSGARVVSWRHGDLAALEDRLRAARGGLRLVVADAVFSMDGDVLDLPGVLALCRRYGAALMVDEAHSLGVLGDTGRGIEEHFGVAPGTIDIKMGTLSKAIPSVGGYLAGSHELIRALKTNGRGFIFSAALPAPQVAAALETLQILGEEPQRVQRLRDRACRFRSGLADAGFDVPEGTTPIVPVLLRREEDVLALTRACLERGAFVVPVVYPAVPRNKPRLRATVTAAHTEEQVDAAVRILTEAGRALALIPGAPTRLCD